MWRTIQKILSRGFYMWLWIAFFLVFSRYYVEIQWGKDIVALDEITEEYDTALMLGTNTRLSNGWWNLFHYYRVQAIVQLVEQEKISTVLVSGDNGTVEYNEPEAMQADLIEYKVPDDMIELDYAWFRTLDSIVRSRTAFGKEHVIIVSQRFHIERALVIAQHFGIDAVGYAAPDVAFDIAPRVYIREVLARAKMVIDLYLLRTQPKYEK